MTNANVPALVPSAGHSTRMGRPKLVLPLADGKTVIGRLVRALREGGATPVIVIVPPSAQEGADILKEEAQGAGATVVVCAGPTADMRATVEVGLRSLTDEYPGVLLVPGDSPGVTAPLVSAVLEAFRAEPGRIVVPVFQGRRGHPIALPMRVCRRVASLPYGKGINALVRDINEDVNLLECTNMGSVEDLDTPEDYAWWLSRGQG